MNQPAHPLSPLPVPEGRREALPRTLVADALCAGGHLALYLGRAVRARFPAPRPRDGFDQAGRIGNLRPQHLSSPR